MAKRKILFVVDSGAVDYSIPGGIQLCTAEVIEYFKLTSFDAEVYPVTAKWRFSDKVRRKLGLEIYGSSGSDALALRLAHKIQQSNIDILVLNQIGFGPLVNNLRAILSRPVTIICLSHGNESGDFLHEIESRNPVTLWKLGSLMYRERQFYQQAFDGVIVISEHEVSINRWLGAQRIFVLPRMLKKEFLHWQPVPNRIGFVGTLNHPPNLVGLKAVLHILDSKGFAGKVRIVGGPSETGRRLENEFRSAEYVGQLPSDKLEKEAQTWSIFLNPVFWFARGSSTKLAQGLNWGIPVLTTAAGRRGYSLRDENIVATGLDADAYADAIIEACANPGRLQTLRRSVEINVGAFDKQLVATDLERFVLSVASWKANNLHGAKAY